MCKAEDDTYASDEDILIISKRLTRQNKEAANVSLLPDLFVEIP